MEKNTAEDLKGEELKLKKALLSTIIISVLVAGMVKPAVAQGEQPNKLFINRQEAVIAGEIHNLDVPPRVWKGTTMLPLRFVVENILHGDVHWDPASGNITISNEEVTVRLRLNEAQAVVNGTTKALTIAPFTEQDRTLVPVRFLAETFGYEVQYDSSDKSITLRPALPPVAQFRLSRDTIIAGQTIEAADHSYDPYGYPIVERRWQINRDPKLRTNNLASIFSSPGPGQYIVGLQVKNKAGRWSDWAEQIVYVKPNEPPVVEELRPVKPVIKQGENLDFIFRVRNEDWEKIVEERWAYRHLHRDLQGNGKPRSLFAPGDYEVTLQVKDAYGNWSELAGTLVTVSDQMKNSELEYKFRQLRPGEVIDNPDGFNYNNLVPEQRYQARRGGPTLLLSNSPEVIPAPGILYRDKVSDSFRIMFHHLNNTGGVKQLVVTAENQGSEPVTLTQTKSVTMGPTADVMHLGQSAALEYLQAPRQNKTVILQPGQKYLLYQSPNTDWKNNEAITGYFDLTSNGPVSITVAALGSKDVWDNLDYLPLLPRDIHPRGTFPNADLWVDIYLNSGEPRKIELGKDQQGFESWLAGYDALTGAAVINRGNYGSLYHLTFHAGTRTGVLLNPRGSSFKGAFTGFDGKSYRAPAYGYFQGSRRGTVVGVLEPAQPKTLIYLPPNGSDAPVIFGLIPEAYWSEF